MFVATEACKGDGERDNKCTAGAERKAVEPLSKIYGEAAVVAFGTVDGPGLGDSAASLLGCMGLRCASGDASLEAITGFSIDLEGAITRSYATTGVVYCARRAAAA